MRALVVYESMFGNTRRIAEAITSGLGAHARVDLVEVGEAMGRPLPDGLDLVVLGGPTHTFGMSRANTRRSAAAQATRRVIARPVGIRDWIDRYGPDLTNVAAAVFDTKLIKPHWLPGSASASATKALRRHGVTLVVRPTSFYVSGSPGPLVDGELERARIWGVGLSMDVPAFP